MIALPRAVTIHGLDHARAALAPGLPVLLLSSPGAACFAGAGWWRALVALALEGREGALAPDALDCADQPGRALEALHAGCRILVLLPCPAFADIAARAPHARLLQARPPSLDLGPGVPGPHAQRRLLAWLQA